MDLSSVHGCQLRVQCDCWTFLYHFWLKLQLPSCRLIARRGYLDRLGADHRLWKYRDCCLECHTDSILSGAKSLRDIEHELSLCEAAIGQLMANERFPEHPGPAA